MDLSAHQQEFRSKGYTVIRDFMTRSEIALLKRRSAEICEAHDITEHKTVFTTDREKRKAELDANRYFLESDLTIRCFLEEGAFDSKGELAQALTQSVNKIGHALHRLDPVFASFSQSQKIRAVARALGLAAPQIRQSMYIFKQPRIGGRVDWHQDASFFFTEPGSVITFWFALDDAHLKNGCLFVLPGGQNFPLKERFIRTEDRVEMIAKDEKPWPQPDEAVPLEVKAGTLICFHGQMPHFSNANRSDTARHAFTLHVTDGACEYSRDNWIQDPDPVGL